MAVIANSSCAAFQLAALQAASIVQTSSSSFLPALNESQLDVTAFLSTAAGGMAWVTAGFSTPAPALDAYCHQSKPAPTSGQSASVANYTVLAYNSTASSVVPVRPSQYVQSGTEAMSFSCVLPCAQLIGLQQCHRSCLSGRPFSSKEPKQV